MSENESKKAGEEAEKALKPLRLLWKVYAIFSLLFIGIFLIILGFYFIGILVALIILLYSGETNLILSKYSWLYVYVFYKSKKKRQKNK